MAYSNIVDEALSHSLKKLMMKKPLNKITVQQITDDCGITRHTFYNHFQDIYELLEWTYEHEVIDGIEPYKTEKDWDKAFMNVLDYVVDNRAICLNTFHSVARDRLEVFLYNAAYEVMDGVIKDIVKDNKIDIMAENEIADFYARAIVGQVVQWLRTDLREDKNQLIERTVRMMKGTVKRLIEENTQKDKTV